MRKRKIEDYHKLSFGLFPESFFCGVIDVDVDTPLVCVTPGEVDSTSIFTN